MMQGALFLAPIDGALYACFMGTECALFVCDELDVTILYAYGMVYAVQRRAGHETSFFSDGSRL